MITFDANATEEKKEYTTLPNGTYSMKPAADVTVEWRGIYEDRKLPPEDQRQELDLVINWEVAALTEKQQEIGIELGERVRQWIKVILDNRDEYEQRGRVSKFTNKFRDFVRDLSVQGLIPATYQAATSEEVAQMVADALNEKQPMQEVLVKEYVGENGSKRNKVDTVSAPPQPRRRPGQPTRNVAVATQAASSEDVPF